MGFWSLLSSAHVRIAKPICFRLLVQLMRCARALARASAGSNMAARMAMIAITTNNSIRVKADFFWLRFFILFDRFIFWFWQQGANFKSIIHSVNLISYYL